MAPWIWSGFILLVLLLLAFDLGVVHRRSKVIAVGEALAWTTFYVVLALAFNVLVFFLYERHWLGAGVQFGHDLGGGEAAVQFFTAWLLEKSLSLDNIFVIALIFASLRIPAEEQHHVLFWGILGALVLRGILIGVGAALMASFGWIIYVFGGILLLTAVKMLVARHDNVEPDQNPLVRLFRRLYPVTETLHGSRFFVQVEGRRMATRLFVTLILVESSDLLFAVDSIPAAFAVTTDPFLVFTSNIFAVLGLRALYFVLAGLMSRFRYIKMSLVFLLAYVGVKMLLSHAHPIPNLVSLAIIAGILSVGILASCLAADRDTAPLRSPLPDELTPIAGLTSRQALGVVALVAGTTLLILGLALLVFPDLRVKVAVLGLGVLALQIAWAKIWLRRLASNSPKTSSREH